MLPLPVRPVPGRGPVPESRRERILPRRRRGSFLRRRQGSQADSWPGGWSAIFSFHVLLLSISKYNLEIILLLYHRKGGCQREMERNQIAGGCNLCSRQPFGAGSKIPPVQCTEGTGLEFQHQTAGERAAVQYLMGFLNFCLGEGAEDMGLDFALVEHGENLLPQQL